MKITEVLKPSKLPDPSRSPIIGRNDQKDQPVLPNTQKMAVKVIEKLKK
jgi:hypothetical protein